VSSTPRSVASTTSTTSYPPSRDPSRGCRQKPRKNGHPRRPYPPPMERVPQPLPRRPAPAGVAPYRRGARPVPQAHERGYGIEL
jgi:hypothetical protein